MRIIFLLTLLFSLSLTARAAKTDDADALYALRQYDKAQKLYESMLRQRNSDAVVRAKYANCCYHLKQYEEALRNYQLLPSRFPQRELFIGQASYQCYRFEEARTAFQNYLSTLKPDDARVAETQRKLRQAENGISLLSKTDEIVITDSVLVAKNEFLKFYQYSQDLGTLKQDNRATKGFEKISFITQRGDRTLYSDTIHGKSKIMSAIKLLDKWSESVPLPAPVNQKNSNENYPFLAQDGVTFYFASDNENSVGGYDIFVTRFNPAENSYLTPENIGFPYNSPANDYMMVIDDLHHTGIFATDRNQSPDKVMIYSFIHNEMKKNIKSDDPELIRRSAMLKKYKTGKKVEIHEEKKIVQVKKQNEMNFIVNDTLCYHSEKEFQSSEALEAWKQQVSKQNELKANTTKLESTRNDYENAGSVEEKSSIRDRILRLETDNIRLKNELNELNKSICRFENEFLLQKK